MNGKDILFLVFAVITVGSAALVVFSKRITYAAFSLMLSFFGVAGLYIFLSADFLAAVQLIIYVGGILILLLFGILLTVKISSITATTETKQRIWGTIAVTGFLVLILNIIHTTPWVISLDPGSSSYAPQSELIGNKLMTEYILPFEVASILLLASLIGAMFIVRSEEK
jgi:NADH:ubiquinone oxidoreductase subunit 6 (subunit J)